LMVSPGLKFGMSVRRLFASSLSMIWFVMMLPFLDLGAEAPNLFSRDRHG
jgi:hypothetical protein